MSTYLPNILVFRKSILKDVNGKRFNILNWENCRYLSFCLIPSAKTCSTITENKSIKSIIRGKTNQYF